MDKFEKDSVLRCNVTTSPSSRPMLSRRLSRRPKIVLKPDRGESTFQRSNNEKETYSMGVELQDLVLTCNFFSEDDKKFLDELKARKAEAYIYSAIPGSLFQHCPLTRGIKGDPSDGTYVGVTASGTTVFFPRGDTSSVVYFEETDFENNPILANGMEHQSASEDFISKDMPLGRGVVLLSTAKNMVQNSLFADVGGVVYNWTHSTASTTRIKQLSWMGVDELWVWGAEDWISDDMSLVGYADGDFIALSYGWRTDGEMRCRITWDNGIGTTTTDFTTLEGCGYNKETVAIPVGYGGVGCDMNIEFSLNAGIFGGFCAPQVILGATGDGGRKQYPAFIGGSGDGIQGAITSQSLKFTGEWQAAMWTDQAGGSDSFLCASGYIMPMTPQAYHLKGKRVFAFENAVNKETECYLKTSGLDLKMFLSSDATGLGSVILSNFTKGDVLYVALSVGWTNGLAHKKVQVRIVGDTTTYEVDDVGTADFFTMFDTLWVGCDENQAEQADGIFQSLDIWAGTEAQITNQVVYMADPTRLEEHMETFGRKFRLYPAWSPNPYNRQLYDGTLNCVNTKVL